MTRFTIAFFVLAWIGCTSDSPDTSEPVGSKGLRGTSSASRSSQDIDAAVRELMHAFQTASPEADNVSESHTKLPFSISRETTYLVRPIRENGKADYLAALNEAARQGVTPENNAAVMLMQMVGPSDLEIEFRNRFYEMIEMDPLSEEGDYFVPIAEHFPEGIVESKKAVRKQLMGAPWSRKQSPSIAEWIDRNEQPLARLTVALERDRYYMPLIAPEKSPQLLFARLFAVSQYREIGQALVTRSMLRINDGAVQGAWEDIKATLQLASLISQGLTSVELLMSVGLQEEASRALCELIASDKLTSTLSQTMLDEVHAIPALSGHAERVNFNDRFSVLEGVIASAVEGQEPAKDDHDQEPLMDPAVYALVDWDQALRVVNSWYNDLVEAHEIEDYPARKEALDAIDRKKAELIKAIETVEYEPFVREHFGDHEYSIEESTSYQMGILHIGLLAPASEEASDFYYRSLMRRNLAHAALAAIVYRFEYDSMPADFSDLAPTYLPNPPKDLYSTQTLLLRRVPAGYLLYSVGPNLLDDGGNRSPEHGGADDLSVTIPG